MALNVAAADIEPYVRRIFLDDRVRVIGKPSSTFYMEVRKQTAIKGQLRLSLIYGDGPNRSATFSVVQANAGAVPAKSFQIDSTQNAANAGLANDFAVYRLSNQHLRTADNVGAVVSAFSVGIDGCIRKVKREVQLGMYDPDGARVKATVVSAASAPVYTFANNYEARRFQINDKVVMAATRTGALRNSGQAAKVIAVTTGATPSITLDATITGGAANDLVFLEGDAANNTGIKGGKGIPSWIPETPPTTGDSHYSVDRSVEVEKFSGFRTDASSAGSMEDAITQGAEELYDGTQGEANPDMLYLSSAKWRQLSLELSDRNVGLRGKSTEFGYSFIEHHFGPYTFKVVPDPENHTSRGFLLDMSTWVLMSAGEIPHFAEEDGNRVLRSSGDPGLEARMDAYWVLGCPVPFHNNNIKLP